MNYKVLADVKLLRKLTGANPTTQLKQDLPNDIHVMPKNSEDIFDHIGSVNCACSPRIDSDNAYDKRFAEDGDIIWVHRRIKGSEELV